MKKDDYEKLNNVLSEAAEVGTESSVWSGHAFAVEYDDFMNVLKKLGEAEKIIGNEEQSILINNFVLFVEKTTSDILNGSSNEVAQACEDFAWKIFDMSFDNVEKGFAKYEAKFGKDKFVITKLGCLVEYTGYNKYVAIPDTVKEIGEGAFAGCKSLESVNIPNSVTSIGKRAFESCELLKEVILSKCLTEIEEDAFFGCESLKGIKIPDSVTKIANDSFAYCPCEAEVWKEFESKNKRDKEME